MTALRGCIVAIDHPSRFALIPCLTPRTDLPAAVATNSVLFNTARFVGPSVAGIIIANGGISLAFGVNAISYMAYIYALLRLSIHPAPRNEERRFGVIAQSINGYRYGLSHMGIRTLMVLYFAATALVYPIVEFLPAVAGTFLSAGVSQLASMNSAMGFGAVAGGLMMMRGLKTSALLIWALASLAAMSVSLAAFSLVASFTNALLLLAGCGFAISVNAIAIQTLHQESVDDRLRGRIMSLYGMIFRGGPAIGAPILGMMAEHIGLRPSFAGAALICFWCFFWIALQKRKILGSLRFGDTKDTVSPARPA